ncbi:MAG: SEC-C metal-binding domain-containing protein [Proteobacteria bacterium]|nr:SEC-C metal-binding domain-containing protein [Pseudomonadota bacterium]
MHTISQLDHIAMVKQPQDKRCVAIYENDGEQFKLIRYLSVLLTDNKLKPLDFGELKFSKRQIKNPDYRKLRRNDQCFCGSGKKFKKCCISNEYIEGDHVDIVATPRQLDHTPNPVL